MIRNLLREEGIAATERVVMVGDRKYDVVGAHETGMECVGVLYGYGTQEELSTAGADRIVPTVGELARLFGLP